MEARKSHGTPTLDKELQATRKYWEWRNSGEILSWLFNNKWSYTCKKHYATWIGYIYVLRNAHTDTHIEGKEAMNLGENREQFQERDWMEEREEEKW